MSAPFIEERSRSLDHLRLGNDYRKERAIRKVEHYDAMFTPWPAWVYRMHDPIRLANKIQHNLQFIETSKCVYQHYNYCTFKESASSSQIVIKNISSLKGGSVIPKEPTELSYWVAQNLPLEDKERIVLLNYDCSIPRLQQELKYLTEVGR